MYPGILAKVHETEKKNGITYIRTEDTYYKVVKFIYFIAEIWMFFMNLFFVLGFWARYTGTESMGEALKSMITVSVCTLCIIAGCILNTKKLYISGWVLNFIPACFLIPVFASFMKDELGFLGFVASFYWRHLVPIVLLVIAITILTFIAMREKHQIEQLYKKVVENLFAEFGTKDDHKLTEQEWEEFLKNYDPYKKSTDKKQKTNE